MKKYFYLILAYLLAPHISWAATSASSSGGSPLDSVKAIGTLVYGGSGTPYDIKRVISGLIQIFLGLIGIIFLLLIIWSGFRWMTSGGNEKTVEEAKKTLQNSVVGLIIVVMGYSIAYWIIVWLGQATTGAGTTGGPVIE
ncbi:MAG: hypothetical protein V1846_02930 [Candidatus Komeilibacteria bacterium]